MPSRCASCLSGAGSEAAERDDAADGNAAGPSSSAAAVVGDEEAAAAFVDIPVVADRLSFDESLAAETRKLDEMADRERRRQWRRWRDEVDVMRDEIVPLGGRRTAVICRSQSPPTTKDCVTGADERPAARQQPQLPPHYFRRFFDTSGFDQETVRVSIERETLVVGGDRLPVPEQYDETNNRDTSSVKSARAISRYYRFSIPPTVDLATIRAVLSTDGVLLVEADTGTGTLNSPDQSVGSGDSAGPPTTMKREKIGKPVFHDDDDGKRRMRLLVDVGDSFRPKDIYVQAIKSDRFQVWAKRRFKTPERYLRAKYRREFELNEKIVSNTLWARLEPNGRLVVGAVAKRQPPQPHPPAQSTTSTTGTEAALSTIAGSDRNDAASVDAETTSFPPEAATARCPDILITCPDSAPNVDNGCCSSSNKE